MASKGIKRSPLGPLAIGGILAVTALVGTSVYLAWLPCGEAGCVQDAVAYQPETEGERASGREVPLDFEPEAPPVVDDERIAVAPESRIAGLRVTGAALTGAAGAALQANAGLPQADSARQAMDPPQADPAPAVEPAADETPRHAAPAIAPADAVVVAVEPSIPRDTLVQAQPELESAPLPAAESAARSEVVAMAKPAPPIPEPAPPKRETDLTGLWDLQNAIDTTTYFPYLGLRLGYRVRLQQNGSRIVGAGQRQTENGRPLSASERNPIRVEGSVDGGTVTLQFSEIGRDGATTGGTMTWRLGSDGARLSGRFSSSAAKASGPSQMGRASN